MHDFILAKEIVESVIKIAKEKELSDISKVSLEIGQIALAHDGFPEHMEDISIENLNFGIQTIVKGTFLENAKFDIKKIQGENWKIIILEGE